MKPRRYIALILAGLIGLPAAGAASASQPVPRKILALVDVASDTRPPPSPDGDKKPPPEPVPADVAIRLSRIHSVAEMPLNRLGLDVVYWDVGNGLPDLAQWPDLRGIITWFADAPFSDPAKYIGWATAAIDHGVKLVVLGQPGVRNSKNGQLTPLTLVNRFFGRFGVRDDDGYTDLTHNSAAVMTDPMFGFERKIGGILPGYPLLRQVDPRVTPLLTMRKLGDPTTDSTLAAVGPTGGYIAEGYERYFDTDFIRSSWVVNPFEFFRRAYATDDLPKPDPTTLSGRRIYFSHIDGDGFRNQTEVKPYAEKNALSATVVRRELIERYPDLPVSAAPIVGDLDSSMAGTPATREEARQLFALPQVEVASHTWSHPFDWGFFRDYVPEKEKEFAGGAKDLASGAEVLARMFGRQDAYKVGAGAEGGAAAPGEKHTYASPRAFSRTPFNIRQEVVESLSYMDALAPPGKPKARLIQWSGNTLAWEGAIAMVRQAGFVNMNGGDPRFDAEYPSYASVCPVGRLVGKERQIYAAGSNENTYTDLWTNRFFGFQNLHFTLFNTETPIRVKPFNIYYHFYSGQKFASLQAVKRNLDLARASEIAPVAASTYVDIANGYYSTQFVEDGPRRWRVLNRGALATIRFDYASMTAVDFSRSSGVLGQRHFQGSLYVALDPAIAEPVVALTDVDRADVPPAASGAYLVNGRWAVSNLQRDGQRLRFRAQGYGQGDMEWYVPWAGQYRVTVRRNGDSVWQGIVSVSPQNERMVLALPVDAIVPVDIAIVPKSEDDGREGR